MAKENDDKSIFMIITEIILAIVYLGVSIFIGCIFVLILYAIYLTVKN